MISAFPTINRDNLLPNGRTYHSLQNALARNLILNLIQSQDATNILLETGTEEPVKQHHENTSTKLRPQEAQNKLLVLLVK